MDYSSNMNIIVTVIRIIINSMGGVDYYRFRSSASQSLVEKGKVEVEGERRGERVCCVEGVGGRGGGGGVHKKRL